MLDNGSFQLLSESFDKAEYVVCWTAGECDNLPIKQALEQ